MIPRALPSLYLISDIATCDHGFRPADHADFIFVVMLLLAIGTVGAITVDQYFAADESGSQGISGTRHDAVRTTKFTDTAASIQQDQEQTG